MAWRIAPHLSASLMTFCANQRRNSWLQCPTEHLHPEQKQRRREQVLRNLVLSRGWHIHYCFTCALVSILQGHAGFKYFSYPRSIRHLMRPILSNLSCHTLRAQTSITFQVARQLWGRIGESKRQFFKCGECAAGLVDHVVRSWPRYGSVGC